MAQAKPTTNMAEIITETRSIDLGRAPPQIKSKLSGAAFVPMCLARIRKPAGPPRRAFSLPTAGPPARQWCVILRRSSGRAGKNAAPRASDLAAGGVLGDAPSETG